MDDFSPVFSLPAQELLLSSELESNVLQSRKTIEAILTGQDKRILLIVGPCSIHNTDAALEYARLLKNVSLDVADTFFIVMRTYLEKSRTALGWKGFLLDPDRDNSCDIRKGIREGRALLCELARMKMPTASEFLDPLLHHFYSDLISWGSIGARTVQSPPHRHLASSLPMPVGFKNRTDGNIDVAIQAIQVAEHPHTSLGISRSLNLHLTKSPGNPFAHLVLRGGKMKGNFDPLSIRLAMEKLREKNLLDAILVDCSHGNSQKNYKNQKTVFESVMKTIQKGETSLRGVMLESFLEEGQIDVSSNSYGMSVTDACLNFYETEALIRAHATCSLPCEVCV